MTRCNFQSTCAQEFVLAVDGACNKATSSQLLSPWQAPIRFSSFTCAVSSLVSPSAHTSFHRQLDDWGYLIFTADLSFASGKESIPSRGNTLLSRAGARENRSSEIGAREKIASRLGIGGWGDARALLTIEETRKTMFLSVKLIILRANDDFNRK